MAFGAAPLAASGGRTDTFPRGLDGAAFATHLAGMITTTTRDPLETAFEIPPESAGLAPLFFFGTLTDLDVLGYVLARKINEANVTRATIEGFARERVRGASYPMLVPRTGEVVDGMLLAHVSRRDIVRINYYESEEYRAERHEVSCIRGGRHHAWLYAGIPGVMVSSGEPWDLESWKRTHKADFFAQCDGWMAGCPQ